MHQYSDEALTADLKCVAGQLGRNTVPQKTYGDIGAYDYTTVSRRFGTWNKALKAAGLSLSKEIWNPSSCPHSGQI